MFSAPWCGEPSQWRALTMVASTASWHPPNSGRPSTTTSSRRPSAGCGSARSKSRTMTFWVTLPPASRHTRAIALSKADPLRPNTPARAHDGSVVEKFVESAATPACVQRWRQWESKTSQHHDSEERWDGILVREVCRSCWQSQSSSPGQPVTSPALSRWGANDQTLPLGARAPPWTNHMLPTSVTFLAPVPQVPRVRGVFPRSKPATLVVRTHRPRSSLLSAVPQRTYRRAFQFLHKCSRNVRVPLENHWHGICPARPVRRSGHSGSVPQPHAAQTQRHWSCLPQLCAGFWVHVKYLTQTLPQTRIMALSVRCGGFRFHDSPATTCRPVLTWQILHSSHKSETARQHCPEKQK